MTPEEVIAMARDAGLVRKDRDPRPCYAVDAMHRFAALVAANERERIALEFDRRVVPGLSGWYEPEEPAEIIRGMGKS